MDELVPISRENWTDLRDLFRTNWPTHELPHNVVQNYIDWIQIDAKIAHLQVFSLNGTWRSNGTFIIIDRYELYCYTLEESNDSLLRALKLVDWDYSYRICAILDRHQPALEAVFADHPHCNPLRTPNHVLHLSREKALQLEIALPEGFRLANLDLKHAPQVNQAWPFHCDGSEFTVKRCLAWNTNVGLFNQEAELVGWCLHSNLGFLSYLHVDDRCRNRGFGELMVRAISRKVAEKGLNVYGGVRPDNGPSRRLFQKVGFEQRQAIAWIRSRTGKLVEWGIS
ncbi:uncharacterized protein LOC120419668 [Culex pipiens pallens]|uniref:uncharacterized protein LOC120419668 n=1 Tax=Culex pipiens pallens TaxID=42434 RepID=UPI001954C5BE|nr:uncharacterized protein LOC120419668 [Culex pipiens pallens]